MKQISVKQNDAKQLLQINHPIIKNCYRVFISFKHAQHHKLRFCRCCLLIENTESCKQLIYSSHLPLYSFIAPLINVLLSSTNSLEGSFDGNTQKRTS